MSKHNPEATCSTCPYYREALSWCIRAIPVVKVDLIDLDKGCDNPDNIFLTGWWPQVSQDDYCAEHPDFWKEIVDE